MAEDRDRATPERQAIWVALRTLRQRPTVVARTDEGATVYEVRSIRMVLPQGSAHFKRLVPCAKCGREVPGAPVMVPADLDHPPNPVFCDRCVRSPVQPRSETQDERAPAAKPASPPVVGRKPAPEPASGPLQRLAAVEGQLAEAMSRPPSSVDGGEGLQRLAKRVAGELQGQHAELAKMSAAVVEVRAELRQLAARLAAQAEEDSSPAIEATLASELSEIRAGMAAMVDARAQPLQAALADGLDDLRAQIDALQQRIEEGSVARWEVEQLAGATHSLAVAHRDLDQRVGELATQLEAGRGAALEAAREIAEIRAGMAAMVDARAQPLQAALADGLDHQGAQIAALQQRIEEESAARSEMAQVAEVTRALAQAQRDLDQRMRELAIRMAASPGAEVEAALAREIADARADVAATVDTEHTQVRVELAEGLHLLRAEIASLEQRHGEELAAVAALLEGQRNDLTEALHDVAHETLMSVAEPLRDLTKAREEFERRLESLQRRALEDERRMEALNATASAGASRLHALEQRLHVSVQRLMRPAATGSGGQEPAPAPQLQRRAPGALLESLERQLQEAEERLSDL